MRRPKIDLPKMRAMLRQGKTQRQVAEFFGCTKSAISQASRNLNKDKSKVTSLELASKVVSSELNVVSQISKINDASLYLLDLCLGVLKGDKESLESLKESQKELPGITFKDPQSILLGVISEIRKNVSTQIQVLETLHSIENVMAFQDSVLEVLAEVEPRLKDEVLFKLKERRLLRQSVTYRR